MSVSKVRAGDRPAGSMPDGGDPRTVWGVSRRPGRGQRLQRGSMTPFGSDHGTGRSWQRPIVACLVTLGLVVLILAVIGVATAIEQHANPPTCIGLGFGCTPDAYTNVVLGGMFVGVPVLAVAWTSIVAGWLVTRRRSDRINHRATWWPAWLLAGCLAIVTVVAAITAG